MNISPLDFTFSSSSDEISTGKQNITSDNILNKSENIDNCYSFKSNYSEFSFRNSNKLTTSSSNTPSFNKLKETKITSKNNLCLIKNLNFENTAKMGNDVSSIYKRIFPKNKVFNSFKDTTETKDTIKLKSKKSKKVFNSKYKDLRSKRSLIIHEKNIAVLGDVDYYENSDELISPKLNISKNNKATSVLHYKNFYKLENISEFSLNDTEEFIDENNLAFLNININ